MNEKLLANVRFYFAQSVFNSRCHFKAMDRLTKRENTISIFINIISAITIISLILQIFGFESNYQIIIHIAICLGLFSTATSLIVERFNRNDRMQNIFQHKLYAEKYKTLRDEYMSLIADIMSNNIQEEQILIKRDYLQKRYSNLGENAPVTEMADYKKTQEGLGILKEEKEEFTWPDSEIDKFLPTQLRIS